MMIPSFEKSILEQISNCIGDTDTGLTGSEIAKNLQDCGIQDISPNLTKRIRLLDALTEKQRKDNCANNICNFIKHVMNPVKYLDSKDCFIARKIQLNEILSFAGIKLDDKGDLVLTKKAVTIEEAKETANQLRKLLIERKVHHDVLKFCTAELVELNYFHAVLEASKSVSQKIRKKSGLNSDAATLVDEAFGFGKKKYPVLAFNSLSSSSEINEHRGLMNLMKGFFATFRNTTAHAPKIEWDITEQDALDMMTIASLLHRRLDKAVKTEV